MFVHQNERCQDFFVRIGNYTINTSNITQLYAGEQASLEIYFIGNSNLHIEFPDTQARNIAFNKLATALNVEYIV